MPLVNIPLGDIDRLNGGDFLLDFDEGPQTSGLFPDIDRSVSGGNVLTDANNIQPNTVTGASQSYGLLRNRVLTLADVSVASRANATLLLPARGCVISFHVNVETLSTPAERFIFRCGLGFDPYAGEPTHGVYFEYSDNIATGQWNLCCANGGSRTKVSSGNNVSAGVFQSLGIRMLQNNTIALFSINDIPISNIQTNIPQGAQTMGLFTRLEKTVGSGTQRRVFTDFIYFSYSVQR